MSKTNKIKHIAVVCSGWHYPLHFYESMLKQSLPDNWQAHYFCVSHRDPIHAQGANEVQSYPDDTRGTLDKVLYKEIANKEVIKNLGWVYKEYPNTVGDWGCTNQWLDDYNYKDYDLFLFTHDDNLILNNRVFIDTIEDPNFKKWDICTNSPGAPYGSIRGSFEFFKPKVLKLLGGKFDLSWITLDRIGKTDNPDDLLELNDWNNIVYPLNEIIKKHNLRVAMMSPCYRVSAYCIEGERGFISRTHGQNTQYEDAGLQYLKDNKII